MMLPPDVDPKTGLRINQAPGLPKNSIYNQQPFEPSTKPGGFGYNPNGFPPGGGTVRTQNPLTVDGMPAEPGDFLTPMPRGGTDREPPPVGLDYFDQSGNQPGMGGYRQPFGGMQRGGFNAPMQRGGFGGGQQGGFNPFMQQGGFGGGQQYGFGGYGGYQPFMLGGMGGMGGFGGGFGGGYNPYMGGLGGLFGGMGGQGYGYNPMMGGFGGFGGFTPMGGGYGGMGGFGGMGGYGGGYGGYGAGFGGQQGGQQSGFMGGYGSNPPSTSNIDWTKV